MKLPLSLVLTTMLLAGCPDTKLPKVPPSVPEPKAAVSGQNPSGRLAHVDHHDHEVSLRSTT